MIPLSLHAHGYLLGTNILLLTDDAPQNDMINLALHKGEAMRYTKDAFRCIDFPGEYEIQGTVVTCFDAGGELSFVLRREEQQVAIIRNTAAIEKESFEGIHVWICANKACSDAVENLEVGGDIVLLESIQ